MDDQTSLLIIYTGGTIGMIRDPETGTLMPFNFEGIYDQLPELKRYPYHLDFYCFDPLLDSSNIGPEVWTQLAGIIGKNYEHYDGFVILHGSDTMAYTASALSFMLENLNKPVILTGSQLPLGEIRTDGRENFLTALEIAATQEDETPLVPEVCIYFENQLLRGNRTVKYNTAFFHAFASGNYPPLAEVGVQIKYNRNVILKPNFKRLKVHQKLDHGVAVLKLYPGITHELIDTMMSYKKLRALVLETFGSGNVPTDQSILDAFRKNISNGLIVVNVTQCITGSVQQGKYQTSVELEKMGVISGRDMTTESAITKLMYLLGRYDRPEMVKELLHQSLRGEMT